MADRNDALMIGGVAAVGVGLLALLSKPTAAPPAPPSPLPPPPPPPAPPPVDTRYRVRAAIGLRVHSAPSLSAPVVGLLADGTPLSIVCQGWGDRVVLSAVWDQISSPIAGWVSDYYVSTPNVGSFSPGLAVCGGGPGPGPLPPPAPAPPPGGLPPTGKPAIAHWQDVRAGMIVSTSCAYGTADYLVEPAGIGLDPLPYGYEPAHRRRRWIATQQTWNKLTTGDISRAGPRNCLVIVTPACLASIAVDPLNSELRYAATRVGLQWFGQSPRIAPSLGNAGWC